MIDYIKGKIVELIPTDLVIECGGIGYHAYISLQTFAALDGKLDTTLYIHHILREDDEMFYGFSSKDERQFFRLLIGVSGVGANTARMMLSSLSADEIREAILSENVARIKGIKGIGSKTAQRIILELKDKVVKGDGAESPVLFSGQAVNATADEAITALVMLGFPRPAVQKLVGSLLQENPTASVEVLIQTALQRLYFVLRGTFLSSEIDQQHGDICRRNSRNSGCLRDGRRSVSFEFLSTLDGQAFYAVEVKSFRNA